jgi:hypothetical protein
VGKGFSMMNPEGRAAAGKKGAGKRWGPKRKKARPGGNGEAGKRNES